MSRPVIGVTGPGRGGAMAWVFTALAILRAGGWPKRITPGAPVLIDELDGLIVGGGADLNPSLYGEQIGEALENLQNHSVSKRNRLRKLLLFPFIYLLRKVFSLNQPFRFDEGRDQLEVGLVKEAMQRKFPVLGICRGAQLLNAVLGGNLHREVREFYTETPYINSILPKKLIHIKPGTLLSRIFPAAEYRVNALNHQAVKNIASDLRVCATEGNGLTQAVEHTSLPFMLGVQWHPEYLPHLGSQQNIFRCLVSMAKKNRN